MRAIIQRVTSASVSVDQTPVASIGEGYLILLGVGQNDTEAEADKLWQKIFKMRIFSDEEGKTNVSLDDIKGSVLIVSQFTLFANCRKGNRPSFIEAGDPDAACALYEYFISCAKRDVAQVEQGIFGADMDVALVNQGPFTIMLDTDML